MQAELRTMRYKVLKGVLLTVGTALITYKITKHSIECREAREHQEELERKNSAILEFLNYDKITADETAELFGIQKSVAYEFLSLCKERGIEL